MPTTTTIQSADGTTLNLLQWAPDETPIGDVLLVHGFAEHMGRYEHVADELSGRGWTVHGPELRGHGQSGGERGHILHWADYIDDVHAALDEVGRPCFVVAHSMGGLVLAATGIQRPGNIRGVVMTNPLIGTAFEPARIKVWGGKVLSKLLPSFSMPGEVDPEHVCRDPKVVADYRADPLVFDLLRARWGMEVLATQKMADAQANDFKLPLMMLVSTGDKVCSAEISRKWFDRTGSSDKDIRVYDELYHELFNEPEKQKVLDDMCDWLEAHRA